MNPPSPRRGPFGHRLLIFVFSVGVSLLAFWLLGYVLRDIDRVKGPDYDQIVTERLPVELVNKQKLLTAQTSEIQRRQEDVAKRRDILRQAVENSQQTIDQLLDLQRLSLEKDASLSTDQQSALADNLQSFLDRQKQSQTLSEELVTLNTAGQELASQKRNIERQLREARTPLEDDYETASRRHDWRLAAIKMGLLLPFVLIAGGMFWRMSGGAYAAIVYAFGAALIGRVLLVMHEHFPAIYFRYLLIGTSLCVAVWVLYQLLRAVRYPSRHWLVKQSREAYAAFVCPQCEYPIQRGPMRFSAWTRRSIRQSPRLISTKDNEQGDRPYTCPCCATQLFEKCDQCGGTRASLLPACDKCGATKPIDPSGVQ